MLKNYQNFPVAGMIYARKLSIFPVVGMSYAETSMLDYYYLANKTAFLSMIYAENVSILSCCKYDLCWKKKNRMVMTCWVSHILQTKHHSKAWFMLKMYQFFPVVSMIYAYKNRMVMTCWVSFILQTKQHSWTLTLLFTYIHEKKNTHKKNK